MPPGNWIGQPMKTILDLKNTDLRHAVQYVKRQAQAIAGGARVFIFGSYARGEERDDSDVDIMIVLPDERSDFAIEDRIRDMAIETGLENDFFSVIIVSESQMIRFRGFKVFGAVEDEGVPV